MSRSSGTAQQHSDPLIGFAYKDDDGLTYRVISFWDVNHAYVIVHDGREEHLRPTGVVRRRQQLDEAA